MYETSQLNHLTGKVVRIENSGMAVDLIQTSEGMLRIGAMPDISKLTTYYELDDTLVVVPEWQVSQAGDNYTGEEFVFWHAQVFGHQGRRYIGQPDRVNCLKDRLEAVFPYFFDEERINIVRKTWLDQWFISQPVQGQYKCRDLEVDLSEDNIVINDGGQTIYNRIELAPLKAPDDMVEDRLAKVASDQFVRDGLEIKIIGSGNGFSGRSASVLARHGKRVIWIDPCAFPAHSLGDAGVHWDDITDILITHNHEDHMSGFSACLERCRLKNQKLHLITGENIFRILKQQFQALFPQIEQLVAFTEINPGTPLTFDGITIDSRWNHHFLPYGTLGIKISGGGRRCGISGDTKFSTRINEVVGRPELEPSWFADCDLVLHEVDFVSPDGVHSYWEEVAKIQDAIAGKLYAYHSPEVNSPPIDLVREGQTFRL
ncbi:MAG: MBL fold metallo-hydrolase [Desulfobacterales bacterium]|nr:MBL fold metallo-hydrolase [Desulfobacterales bacterium]